MRSPALTGVYLKSSQLCHLPASLPLTLASSHTEAWYGNCSRSCSSDLLSCCNLVRLWSLSLMGQISWWIIMDS